MPPDATVQPAPPAQDARPNPTGRGHAEGRPAAGRDAAFEPRVAIDPGTREVVARAVEEASGDIPRQLPEQALRRRRAYARELAEEDEGAPRGGAYRVERIA